MSKLNNILNKKGVLEVDKYLYYNYVPVTIVFMNLSSKQQNKFIKNYLNHEFLHYEEKPFLILDFFALCIEDSNIFINSVYFKTMPKKYIKEIFTIYGLDYKYTDLLSKLIPYTDDESLSNLLTKYLNDNLINAIVNEIINRHYMDLILETINKAPKYLKNKFLNIDISPYSFTDLKKFYTYADYKFNPYTIKNLELKAPDKETLLDALTDIVFTKINNFKDKLSNENNASILLDATNKIKRTNWDYSFDDFYLFNIITDFINSLNKNDFSPENYDYIAEKLLAMDNIEVTLPWLLGTKCSSNYQVIPKLISNKNYLYNLLFRTKDLGYETYIASLVPLEERTKFLTFLIQKVVIPGDIKVVDRIIEYYFANSKDFTINDKNIAFNLIIHGSKYTNYLLHNNIFEELSILERQQILISWKNLNLYDYLAVYGSYILNGRISDIPPTEVLEKNQEMLLSLRKN